MQDKAEKSQSVSAVCAECGTRIAEVLTAGVLGCPACYRAFYTALSSLTEQEREEKSSAAGRERK